MPYSYWTDGDGFYLRDTQGTPHWWRVTVSNTGVVTTTDTGTSTPAGRALSAVNLNTFGDNVLTDATALVNTHIADTSAAHAASAIAFTPTGSVAATDVQAAIAEVAAEGGNVGTAFDGGRAGLFALPIPGTGGTIGLGAQVLHAIRFVPGRDRAIASLKCEVTSGAAGADLDMGILDATGARLRSSGAQADLGATTGVKTCTLSSPYSLVAGTVYYAAVVSDGAVALRSVGLGNAVYLTRFGSTVGLVDYFQDNAHGTSIQATSTVDTPGGAGTLPLLSLHE